MASPTEEDSAPYPRWRLVAGVAVNSRAWNGETVVYFHPSNETILVNELGAVAIDGIAAGCSEFGELKEWCRAHGFRDASIDLEAGLSNLLKHLVALEIITPVA